MKKKPVKNQEPPAPKALLCIVCGSLITDKKKLESPGARNIGLAVCSFACAQQWTIETGMC